MAITYTDALTAEEFNALRTAVGWAALHPDQASASLRGSAYLLSARDGDRAVGMARGVSDGGYVFCSKST